MEFESHEESAYEQTYRDKFDNFQRAQTLPVKDHILQMNQDLYQAQKECDTLLHEEQRYKKNARILEENITQYNEWTTKFVLGELTRIQKTYIAQDSQQESEALFLQKNINELSDDYAQISGFTQETEYMIRTCEEQVGFRFVYD